MATPVNTDPMNALLDEVKRTAGHVAWIGIRVAALEEKTERTENGEPVLVDTMRLIHGGSRMA
jgi:hypothetical protein